MLIGKYRLESDKGLRGGMSEVWKGVDTKNNRLVALKLLSPLLMLDGDTAMSIPGHTQTGEESYLVHEGLAERVRRVTTDSRHDTRSQPTPMLHLEGFGHRCRDKRLTGNESVGDCSFAQELRRNQSQARRQTLQAREWRGSHVRDVNLWELHDRREDASRSQQALHRGQHDVGIDVLKQQRGEDQINRLDVQIALLQVGVDQFQSGQLPLESFASHRDEIRVDVDSDDSLGHGRVDAIEAIAAGASQHGDRFGSVRLQLTLEEVGEQCGLTHPGSHDFKNLTHL